MSELDDELQQYLEAMDSDGFQQVPIGDVGDIVNEILSTLSGDLTAEDVIRFNDRDIMGQPAAKSSRKKKSGRPAESESPPAVPDGAAELLQGAIFPEINDDLESVADRLQNAAQRILSSTEKVEGLMDGLKPKDASVLLEAITEIYSACGFEDITGQTLDRIMGKLRQIEYQSERLLAAMGNKEAQKRTKALEKEIDVDSTRKQEQLLHGPDSVKDANTQEEIDKILASFD